MPTRLNIFHKKKKNSRSTLIIRNSILKRNRFVRFIDKDLLKTKNNTTAAAVPVRNSSSRINYDRVYWNTNIMSFRKNIHFDENNKKTKIVFLYFFKNIFSPLLESRYCSLDTVNEILVNRKKFIFHPREECENRKFNIASELSNKVRYQSMIKCKNDKSLNLNRLTRRKRPASVFRHLVKNQHFDILTQLESRRAPPRNPVYYKKFKKRVTRLIIKIEC